MDHTAKAMLLLDIAHYMLLLLVQSTQSFIECFLFWNYFLAVHKDFLEWSIPLATLTVMTGPWYFEASTQPW